MKAMQRFEHQGPFLVSVIKHSELQTVSLTLPVDYGAIGAEHGITAHSAYCRFKNIKDALKLELNNVNTDENISSTTSPTKRNKRGKKQLSPESRAKKAKIEVEKDAKKGSAVNEASGFEVDKLDMEERTFSKRNRGKKPKASFIMENDGSEESEYYE
ncbi:hypothetical protein H072_5053 [Dactylellina haptotyla CBS 200.50]|uniref:Myb-like DNA-binding domain-containing protein n=1 Tax=Dactylellina haptotyla (strain CBS 200.50) TaxID=1284197 RepID=S8ADH8_DACHA|nr:hypothetical protein H072_5053 [Dactylellina haptotyla CBS 200.50]